MENINVTLGIDEISFAAIAEKVTEIMDITEKVDEIISEIDLDGKINDRIGDYDFDSIIDNWVDYNLDISDKVTDVLSDTDLSQYIDSDNIDVESQAQNLLNGYSPLNSCATGEAFTNAIEEAVRYLLLKNTDFVEHIVKAIDKFNTKQKMIEVKELLIEEVKPMLLEQFKRDLEQYSNDIKLAEAQQLLSQTTTYVIPTIPSENTGY